MKKTPSANTGKKANNAAELDPYYEGEKLYAIGGGRYIQFNGEGPLPEVLKQFTQRTGRKPPFMLLPEYPVDFYLSKGFGGASKVHWSGKGSLPPAVMAYLNDNGTLPRTRENIDEEDDTEDEDDLE